MLQTNHLRILSSSFPCSLSHHSLNPNFLPKPTTFLTPLPKPRPHFQPSWLTLAQLQEPTTPTVPEEGPVELTQAIFATTDDPTPLQVATSVLLTGAIFVFLFRSIRRRAKRAKELKFRSSGAKKTMKEEALDNLKQLGSASVEAKSPPSPAQAILGGITAGVIALILYKFTTTIEAALNRQTVSDNFSVRQITITIRTIVNGLCYLATFVFGINSIGLFLYGGQLAINSFMEDSGSKGTEDESEQRSGSLNSTAESLTGSTELNSSKEDQSSDNTQ